MELFYEAKETLPVTQALQQATEATLHHRVKTRGVNTCTSLGWDRNRKGSFTILITGNKEAN